MIREIKFRALNANDEFIYGLPYTDGVNKTAYYKDFNNRLCWRREDDGAHCNMPYKNGTLQQFTGITDCNGVDIYEGDYIKSIALSNDHNQKGATYFFVVRFFMGSFCFCLNDNESGVPLWPFIVDHKIELVERGTDDKI